MNWDTDHLAWDGVEAVTLEVTTRTAARPVSVSVAKRRAIRGKQRSPSGGVYIGFETRWHLPRRILPDGVVPKPADVIEDDTQTRWTILTVDRNKGGETYALGCVDLTLANDLRDTITIERALVGSDAAGAAVKDFSDRAGRDLYTVAARVQEQTREIAEERGVRYAKERYEITVDRQLRSIDPAEDRVRWLDRGVTRYLDIVSYQQPERIDELPTLTAEDRS